MKSCFRLVGFIAVLFYLISGGSVLAQMTNTPDWMTQPLSLLQALNIALQENATILEAKNDLDASYGIVVQTRAVALPQLTASGQYKYTQPSAIESFPIAIPGFFQQNQTWNAGIQLVQTVYDGGRLVAAVRAARLTKEQALAQYQTTLQDTLLNVRTAYYDALLAEEQITVHEASVKLLQNEVDDQQRRYKAGTVPKFNVLRADVTLANERPLLIEARNSYRIAKNNLSNLLGYNLPDDVLEDMPMMLSDTLDSTPYAVDLPSAIEQALQYRSELVALRKTEELQKLNVVNARAGYKPTLQLFAGYNWFNAEFGFTPPPLPLNDDFQGYNVGAQVSWNIFDGLLTHGKVVQARADYDKSKNILADESRQIELQVRTAYSDFIEANEVLDSQKTVTAEAEEALREARARFDAGTGTQLDVLDAETSLTQARDTNAQALHDYDTARAKLERAIGEDMVQTVTGNY